MSETREVLLDLWIDEDLDRTEVKAKLCIRGREFTAWGRARRNPDDPNIPVVGEELAVARALSELSHRLVEAAAGSIETFEGDKVALHI